jgi:hypothetical protein
MNPLLIVLNISLIFDVIDVKINKQQTYDMAPLRIDNSSSFSICFARARCIYGNRKIAATIDATKPARFIAIPSKPLYRPIIVETAITVKTAISKIENII